MENKTLANPAKKGGGLGGLVRSQQFIAFAAMIVLYFGFFLAAESFRTVNVLTLILNSSYYLAFLGIGVTFVIATGGIDLSLGTVMGCAALLGGRLFSVHGLPMWVALIGTILIAVAFNAINGILIAYIGLPAFVATLGTQMMASGFGQILSKLEKTNWPSTVSDPGGAFKNAFQIQVQREGATNINIPTGLLLLVVFVIVMSVVLNNTKIGRYILSLGSNYEATRLSGVNVRKYQFYAYLINGIFVGLAAIAYSAIYTSITAGFGAGQETNAIAGAVIGGTSLSGGIASIWGTFFGVIMMSVLKAGLPKIGLQSQWQLFLTGIIILVAVIIDVRRNK
ncbi:ABC transporter permease [Globicatella sulfidifaciens]|uniref:ABC transporter permease n=1 Tax=Globicatella sulfidifaciens TaxID=136093 RepID=A0A7X8H149_9LACT|nr:ABC transporter permease [Globicatella sulfidifaciens]NLJ19196.1 ABC transporter permease [Globicatella sulfidifaciens]